MPARNLPERPSLEYLKKIAKERLLALRVTDPAARLAQAQLAVAREYGFPSWPALKAEIDRRRAPRLSEFFQACLAGDLDALRRFLDDDASLVRERTAEGSTAVHLAVRHPEALELLIQHGADPNVRDVGDNATPLHFAAANGSLESVRLLLDRGADVHGAGDLHKGDVIGWAARRGNEPIVDLLIERGARHHIFSAIALGDLKLVEKLVEDNPDNLSRRRSRFENEQTPLHAAFAPPDGLGWLAGKPDYAMLELLIELGADLEATDDRGRTPLAVAILRGDQQAIRLLKAAGAIAPHASTGTEPPTVPTNGVRKSSPMFKVLDMRATVRWYESIGFSVEELYEDCGEPVFAKLSFGNGEFALSPGGNPGPRDVNLWFFTDSVQNLYQAFKEKQLRVMQNVAASAIGEAQVRFLQDLHKPFYGGSQFSISDVNGLELVFWQPEWLSPPGRESS